MNDPPECSYPEQREILRATLEGRRLLAPGDMGVAKTHLWACAACQEENPDSETVLNQIHGESQRQAARDIDTIRLEFLGEKHKILSAAVEAPWPKLNACYADMLFELLRRAGEVQDQLGYVHSCYGSGGFQAIVEKDSEDEDATNECAPFIWSLPEDTRQFVFVAILAKQLLTSLSSYYRLPPKQKLENSLLDLPHLYTTLEAAAAQYLRRYLAEHSDTNDRSERATEEIRKPETERTGLQASLEELRRDMEDHFDSLRAGQMEILRVWGSQRRRAIEYEPLIAEQLGHGFYQKLDRDTKRALLLGQSFYESNTEPDGYGPAIHYFYRAYENEFRVRIVRPLGTRLAELGHLDYELRDRGVYPLMKSGRINEKLGVGQVLRYVRKDELVQHLLDSQGLEISKILETASRLASIRNPSTHDEFSNRESADKFKNLLLGKSSALQHLFPAEESIDR